MLVTAPSLTTNLAAECLAKCIAHGSGRKKVLRTRSGLTPPGSQPAAATSCAQSLPLWPDLEIGRFGDLDICSSDTETAVRVGGGVIMIGWVGGILVEWWNTLLYGCNLVFQLNGEGHSMYYIPCALDDCHDCTSTASS